MSEFTPAPLAVAFTSFNSMRTIERGIASVEPLRPRLVVIDAGSTDGTIERCRALGAEVLERPRHDPAAAKRIALDACRHDRWILVLDSDESLEDDLRAAVADFVRRDEPVAGATINRKVWFLGGWLHHAYQPDRVLRLVRGGAARIVAPGAPDAELHERLVVDGPVRTLAGTCRHDSWADLPDLARRQLAYAGTAANGASGGGTLLHMLVNPPAAMFKQLVIKRGFLDGTRGIIAAGMTYNATMLKHCSIAARRLGPT